MPDGTFEQTITAYRGSGATDFMTQLRAAVTGCPTQTRNGVKERIKLLTGPSHGDDTVLIEVKYPIRDVEGRPTGGDETRLVVAVRLGAVVVILYERGWESGWSADLGTVNGFASTAAGRVRAWLG